MAGICTFDWIVFHALRAAGRVAYGFLLRRWAMVTPSEASYTTESTSYNYKQSAGSALSRIRI